MRKNHADSLVFFLAVKGSMPIDKLAFRNYRALILALRQRPYSLIERTRPKITVMVSTYLVPPKIE
jgi:hypothetical protein